jgi:hypothetical protein
VNEKGPDFRAWITLHLSPEAVASVLVVGVVLLATVGALTLLRPGGADAAPSPTSPTPASTRPTPTPTDPAVARAVTAALTVNERMEAAATALDEELASDPVDIARLAILIRQVNSQASIGLDRVVAQLVAQDRTSAVARTLERTWGDLAVTCRTVLATSPSARSTYIDGAAELITEIEALPAIDERLRALD